MSNAQGKTANLQTHKKNPKLANTAMLQIMKRNSPWFTGQWKRAFCRDVFRVRSKSLPGIRQKDRFRYASKPRDDCAASREVGVALPKKNRYSRRSRRDRKSGRDRECRHSGGSEPGQYASESGLASLDHRHSGSWSKSPSPNGRSACPVVVGSRKNLLLHGWWPDRPGGHRRKSAEALASSHLYGSLTNDLKAEH